MSYEKLTFCGRQKPDSVIVCAAFSASKGDIAAMSGEPVEEINRLSDCLAKMVNKECTTLIH